VKTIAETFCEYCNHRIVLKRNRIFTDNYGEFMAATAELSYLLKQHKNVCEVLNVTQN